jgi:hypothetical protein
MPYFTFYHGLRGCYLPDSAFIVRATTRKELKRAIEAEAEGVREAGMVGMNKRAIAWLAAAAWRNRRKASGEYVAPYREARHTSYPYALGVFVGASRADYLASMEGN